MELYNSDISPYASRCRIQIYHKNLEVEIMPPPGGMRSAEILELNPAGRIPVLVLHDGPLSESWAIMEYLEALHPDDSMFPIDEYLVAKLRELVRFTDLYVAPAMFPMFLALRGTAGKDDVAKALVGLQAQLKIFDRFIAAKDSGPRCGPIDLADAAATPIIYYAQLMAAHFGLPNCLEPLPATAAWWKRVSTQPAAARVLAEMEAGLRTAVPVLFATKN